jgi:hypothetical protein
MRRHVRVSWEAVPHPDSGCLPGIHEAGYEERRKYTLAVAAALKAPDGADRIGAALGLKVTAEFTAPGFYVGTFNPSVQVEVESGEDGPGDAAREQIELYCCALGLVLRQEAVGWHLPFHVGEPERENGILLSLGRPVKPEEMESVYNRIREMSGEETAAGAVLIADAEGLRVLNFTGRPNEQFRELVETAAADCFPEEEVIQPIYFGFIGGLVSNDWSKERHGETLARRISQSGSPDLQRAVHGLLSAIEAVNERFARQQGWDQPVAETTETEDPGEV